MADSNPAPEKTAAADPTPASQQPQSDTRPAQPEPSSTLVPPIPNPNPSVPPPPPVLNPPPAPIQPSFRPAAPPAPMPSAAAAPQFSQVAYQAPGAPPPGVVIASAPAVGSAPPPQVPAASVHPGMAPAYAVAGQPVRYAPPVPNGYPGIPQPFAQGAMPPPGVPHYPSPYAPMVRPAFPPRPLIGVMPPLARPPVVGIRGPIIPPVVRPPAAPSATSAEEPQTTVYVGRISSTVENDFMLSLLQLCGPVKNWKRPQDPTGTLKGFGFCEFESAEGVLRALRLLNKLSVDGQELMLNVNDKTREYLERYVEKKVQSLKNIKGSETEGAEKETVSGSAADTKETVKSSEEHKKPSTDEQKKEDSETSKENPDAANFGLVTEEDRETDREALEKLTGMIEERLKNKPLPPPPPPPQRAVDGPGNSNSEQPSGSRDRETEEDVAKNDEEEKNEDDKTAESKPSSEHDRTETGSPERSRRQDRSRDRNRELRREKERELERYEREREQERAKREKEREYRSREDERRYKAREKEWETREREREHWRKREREREKERAQERRWEIMDQERDGDDSYGKKRKYKTSDEERKRRQREKEEDLADRLREQEEIAEAKMRAEEEQQKKKLEALKNITSQPANGHEKAILPNETNVENHDKANSPFDHKPSHGEGVVQNGISDEFVVSSNFASDARQNSNLPTRKLGFGLSGSGKRAAVPSVFNEDEDEDAHKEKKMRPLVPIDYSTEEQQAIQTSMSEGPSANMVAAAEFVKRISTANPKEEKPDVEKEKSRRPHERSGHRDRDRREEETNSTREESRKDNSDRERSNKSKTPENQKLLDAKQLIDTIPKTKDELFTYEINWAIYDQNALHDRMRPWISKKISDYLGEEEDTLVDYIVTSTQEHVDAGEMLERLQTILDDEAEMFVLKMWRMLIFEIKKVETGLAPRLKS